jgi:hypothetical protein
LSRTGVTHVRRSHRLSPILAGSAAVHVVSLRSTYRSTGSFAGHIVVRRAKSRHTQGRGLRTPVAPTQIDGGAPLTLGPVRHSPTNGRALWMTRRRH